LGFTQSPLEHRLYARGAGDSRLFVDVYVDGLIVMESSSKEINNFKQQMKAEFKMSDLGLLGFYPGIEVHQNRGNITLS
jgi:hypothetical protein